jgi:hypothetical protein
MYKFNLVCDTEQCAVNLRLLFWRLCWPVEKGEPGSEGLGFAESLVPSALVPRHQGSWNWSPGSALTTQSPMISCPQLSILSNEAIATAFKGG